MKISIQKMFENREELDSFIRTTFGEDISKNKDIVIETDKKTLQKLSLSEATTVYGVKIKEAVIENDKIIKNSDVKSN